jgi:hypothetical protein
MLKPVEIAEISLALWYLPLKKVAEIKQLVVSLKKECGFKEPIDDSDEWTDEDLREFTEDSMRRFEEENPWPEEEQRQEVPNNG